MQMPTQARLGAFFRAHVSKQDVRVFLSAFLLGLLTHLFALSNPLINHDGLENLFFENEMTSSGRWFLFAPSALTGDMSVPWVNGIVALIALSLVCVCIVRLLRIASPVWGALTAAVIVTFPALGDTFAYMFTVDAYMIALLLAVIGVCVTDRYRFGFLAGAVLFAFSLGCYQIYFCFAFGLIYIRGIQLLLDADMTARELWRRALRFVLALVLGLAVYLLVLKMALMLRGTALTAYQDIDQTFTATIGDYLFRAFYSYLGYRRTILSANPLFMTTAQRIALFLASAVSVLTSFLLLRVRNIRAAGRWVAAALLLFAMPLAFNSVYLLGAERLHEVMQLALCLPFVLAITLVQDCVVVDGAASNFRNWAKLAACYCVAVITVLVSVLGAFHINRAYLTLDMTNKAASAVMNRLVMRVEATPEYAPGTPVFFSGTLAAGNYDIEIDAEYAKAAGSLAFESGKPLTLIDSAGDMTRMAQYFLGTELIPPSEAVAQALANDSRVLQMPLYPETGSLQMIDGVLVVRLSD